MKKRYCVLLVLCVLVLAGGCLYGGFGPHSQWWHNNIPDIEYSSLYLYSYPMYGKPVQQVNTEHESFLTWQNAHVEPSEKAIYDPETGQFTKDASVVIYTTEDCTFTAGYYKRLFHDLEHADVRVERRAGYSYYTVHLAWKEVEAMLQAEEYADLSFKLDGDAYWISDELGYRIELYVSEEDAQAVQYILKETYGDMVVFVGPEDAKGYRTELLIGGVKAYSCGYYALRKAELDEVKEFLASSPLSFRYIVQADYWDVIPENGLREILPGSQKVILCAEDEDALQIKTYLEEYYPTFAVAVEDRGFGGNPYSGAACSAGWQGEAE